MPVRGHDVLVMGVRHHLHPHAQVRTAVNHAEQERNRMMKTTELVQAFATQAVRELPPLSASEVLSALFR